MGECPSDQLGAWGRGKDGCRVGADCVYFSCFLFVACTTHSIPPTLAHQNPDTPAEKPTLQSYHVDLSQCGPMMLDALVRCSIRSIVIIIPWLTSYRFSDQDQERGRPHVDIQKILPGGYLRFMRHEH